MKAMRDKTDDSPEIISGLLAYAKKHRQLVVIKGGKCSV
jgi:hypothetical protein